MFNFRKRQEYQKPQGVIVRGSEAEDLFDKWNNEVEKLEEKKRDFTEIIPEIESRITEIGDKIKDELINLREYKSKYKSVKTPLAKTKWARKLVYSKRLTDYLNDSKKLMSTNADRVATAIEDASCIGKLLQEKITDAEIYFKLNGCVHLVGNMLAAAEQINSKTNQVENDLEVSTEGLENLVITIDDRDELIKLADKIAN